MEVISPYQKVLYCLSSSSGYQHAFIRSPCSWWGASTFLLSPVTFVLRSFSLMAAAVHSFQLVLSHPLLLLPFTFISSILLSSLSPSRLITRPCRLSFASSSTPPPPSLLLWFLRFCPAWSRHTHVHHNIFRHYHPRFATFLDGQCLRPARHCCSYHNLVWLPVNFTGIFL